ncbi:MAG: LppP/LprE family lipoprotein [Candidatus Baltobacteraceae bacterium]|jgi:hypothetical protein
MKRRILAFAGALGLALGPVAAGAANWLDGPKPAGWNHAGATLPTAPHATDASDFARCKSMWRQPATAEDKALSAAGWHLFNAYRVYDGTALVDAASGVDGMCRPNGYNEFVFVNGVFAGTLAPHLMDSRTDGALLDTQLYARTSITATFERYDARDPLCCPSRQTSVTYRLEGKGAASIVVPTETTTTKNS